MSEKNNSWVGLIGLAIICLTLLALVWMVTS